MTWRKRFMIPSSVKRYARAQGLYEELARQWQSRADAILLKIVDGQTVAEAPPDDLELSILIGDLFNNLRSALNYVGGAVVLADSPKHNLTNFDFPGPHTKPERLQEYGADVQRIMFETRDRWIGVIGPLIQGNNQDKHRLLTFTIPSFEPMGHSFDANGKFEFSGEPDSSKWLFAEQIKSRGVGTGLRTHFLAIIEPHRQDPEIRLSLENIRTIVVEMRDCMEHLRLVATKGRTHKESP